VTEAAFSPGDLVLLDGRSAIYHTDGLSTYGMVSFLDDLPPFSIGVPWSDLERTGFWRCPCERVWKVATGSEISCDRCGASRG
jgi:hypothetical protein